MAHPILSTFSKFKLTPEEQVNGQTLTQNNLYVIQNLICDIAEEKLSLKLDPLNPLVFAQREAELQGQLGILKMLVELSNSSTQPTNQEF